MLINLLISKGISTNLLCVKSRVRTDLSRSRTSSGNDFNFASRKATMPVDRHRANLLAFESAFWLAQQPIFLPSPPTPSLRLILSSRFIKFSFSFLFQ
uniref:Uncharacterized protein n=1 Tax=Rhizophora mucronata TaxID=61149 RepID=A0A2P2KPT3_RHIMU